MVGDIDSMLLDVFQGFSKKISVMTLAIFFQKTIYSKKKNSRQSQISGITMGGDGHQPKIYTYDFNIFKVR